MKNIAYGLYCKSKTSLEVAPPDFSLDFIVPLKLASEWHKCGLIANSLAQHQSEQFQNQELTQSILSTILNELIENAVKFSSDKKKLVTLSLRHFNTGLSIETHNTSCKKNIDYLKQYIQKLKTDTIESLYYDQIEYSAKYNPALSGLGLLSLVKNYQGELGIKIIPKTDPNEFEVLVKIQVSSQTINSF